MRADETVRDAMIRLGELHDPLHEGLRRMLAEFGDQHYHTCPADTDAGPCNCFAGAITTRYASELEQAYPDRGD